MAESKRFLLRLNPDLFDALRRVVDETAPQAIFHLAAQGRDRKSVV